MIEVREATVDDADAIASAHIDGWRVGYRGLLPDEYLDADEFDTARRTRWRAWTWQSNGSMQLFVVSVDDRVVGFGLAGPERLDPEDPGMDATAGERRGEVYAFYLNPSAWGSGGAMPLMRRCEDYLRDQGFSTAVLWVLRDNPRARAFYEKAGWSATGQESHFAPSESPDSPLPEVQYAAGL